MLNQNNWSILLLLVIEKVKLLFFTILELNLQGNINKKYIIMSLQKLALIFLVYSLTLMII